MCVPYRTNESVPTCARTPLGKVLLEQGQLSDAQLREALESQPQRQKRLGEILTQLGYIDVGGLCRALVHQAGLPTVDPDAIKINADALVLFPSELAFRHKILPFDTRNHTLHLAMADPFDRKALEAVRVLSGKHIKRFGLTGI